MSQNSGICYEVKNLKNVKIRKEEFDIDLVKEKNIHTAIAAQMKKAQSDYEAKVKRDEIIQEITSANSLTNSLVDLLIKLCSPLCQRRYLKING